MSIVTDTGELVNGAVMHLRVRVSAAILGFFSSFKNGVGHHQSPRPAREEDSAGPYITQHAVLVDPLHTACRHDLLLISA